MEIERCHWKMATESILSDIPEITRNGIEIFLDKYIEYFSTFERDKKIDFNSVDRLINYATYLHVIVRDYFEGKIKFDPKNQTFYILKRVNFFDSEGDSK